jgi:hypothetical protein
VAPPLKVTEPMTTAWKQSGMAERNSTLSCEEPKFWPVTREEPGSPTLARPDLAGSTLTFPGAPYGARWRCRAHASDLYPVAGRSSADAIAPIISLSVVSPQWTRWNATGCQRKPETTHVQSSARAARASARRRPTFGRVPRLRPDGAARRARAARRELPHPARGAREASRAVDAHDARGARTGARRLGRHVAPASPHG